MILGCKQTNVGQELVTRLQNLNKMLDAIRSAQFDELNLPEINEQNKSTVKPKKLPKREK
ncbi:hypothetical protein EBZ38_11370 [bacterium]|nr:hypothetical protein [bacterium]